MEIGNKIQLLRKQKNLSQEQLAEKLDVTRQTISKWELGETYPDINQALKISKVFNVSLDELTNNEIQAILEQKVSNTEYLAGIIIKILKVFGTVMLIIIITIIVLLLIRKYYEAKENNMVADSYGLYCNDNGDKKYYEVTTTRENPYTFELNDEAEKVIKDMNINTHSYSDKEKLVKDIKRYLISNGINCN